MKKLYSIAILLSMQIASYCQTTYIKTVVHVLYTNSANNISDATVKNYINEVNKGFAKQLSPTFTRATTIFDTLWANTDIQLCLATLDPNGLPTNGITHTPIASPSMDSDNPTSPIWNANAYLNIYFSPVYAEPGFPSFVIGGWASTPTNPQPGSTFNYALVASNSIPFIPQLFTHEIGHIFGMEHLNADVIDDTPSGIESVTPAKGYSKTCNSALQSANTTSLAQDGMHWGGVNPPDMVENFMGLSFCCSYMFTNGQKKAMQTYIQNHLSGWMTTVCSSTTPVMWKSFTANLQGKNKTILQWQTAQEMNSKYFNIQRSVNGIDFVNIGNVNGSGTTQTNHSYQFTDESTPNGIVYYRLQQLDLDGRIMYGNISIVNNSSKSFQIINNNFLHTIYFDFNKSESRNVTFKLFSTNGQLIKSVSSPSIHNQSISTSGLTNGVYVLQIITSEGSYSEKILISH